MSSTIIRSSLSLRNAGMKLGGGRNAATGARSSLTRVASSTRRSLAVRAESETPQAASPEKLTPKPKLSGPAPRRLQVTEGQLAPVLTASLPLVMRAGSGILVSGWKASVVKDEGQKEYTFATFGGNRLQETSDIPNFKRPAEPLQIYEFEACPFCKKVREAVSILDLDVIFYPCPKDGKTWRPKAIELGGKKMFPYMVDPNTGKSMYESDDIIAYLFNEYGDGEVPLLLRLGPVTAITAGLGQVARGGRGATAKPSKIPSEPLVLWGYEGSPFVKLVREVLNELELPYLLKTCARGSPKRNVMMEKYDHFQVPLLEDPNTGEAMFESAYIVEYLERTYAA